VVELEEGDYTDWTIYDSFDDTDAYPEAFAQVARFNTEETVALILDAIKMMLKEYTIASKTLTTVLNGTLVYPYGGGAEEFPIASAYGKFLVVLGASTGNYLQVDRVFIFKDGVLLQTFTDADLGFDSDSLESVSMSPKGKYVMVSGRRTATGNMGWVMLEGS